VTDVTDVSEPTVHFIKRNNRSTLAYAPLVNQPNSVICQVTKNEFIPIITLLVKLPIHQRSFAKTLSEPTYLLTTH